MATEPFEQKFGILADSTLNAKLPEMKTFAIGFQVVDTEDENSRAFGVQLYNIGKHLVMVPMFWLKGKVKGGEVMYVKDLNRFLPFTEVDVNNLKTGKTFSMGDPEPEGDKKSKGDAYSVSTMELNWLNTKRAGEVTLIDKRDIAQMLAHTGEYKMPELKDIRMFGPKAAADFTQTMKDHPEFTNTLMRFHTPEEIADAVMPGLRNGALIEKTASIKPKTALYFVDDPFCKEAKELPMELKQLLMQEGIVAVDSRKEASIALKEKKAVTRYANPTSSGKYKFVGYDGTLKDAEIIVFNGKALGCEEVPCCCNGDTPLMPGKALVVMDGKASYAKPSQLTVDTEDVKDADLGKSVTVEGIRSSLSKPNGEWQRDVFEQKGNVVFYDKSHDTAYCGELRTEGAEIVFRTGWDQPTLRLVLTGKPGTLFIEAGVMYIPSTAKMIDLSSYKRNDQREFKSVQSAVSDTLVRGGFETVKVASDGSLWRIADSKGGKDMAGYNDSFRYLVSEVGLRAKQAAEILADAKADSKFGRFGDGVSFWVKRASFDPADDPWKGVGNDIYETREAGLKLSGPLDDKALKRIDDASKTDVKELFDTQIMTELAKSAYSVDKVQEYLPYMARALDRVCRTLIMFYWHNEDFEERYGKQNIPQLEDSLKDNIQSLGGLISYLKDKTVKDDDMEEDEDELSEEMA